MFGYIIAKKCELRVRDFWDYRSVYCTLCRELRSFGLFADSVLSYDFTFMSLLGLAVSDADTEFCTGRCTVNPLLKKRLCVPDETVRRTAASCLITVKYKLKDDMADERFGKKLLSVAAYAGLAAAFSRASAQYPEVEDAARRCTSRQAQLESELCSSCDKAAQPSADCLSEMFTPLSNNADERRVLSRLGYFAGKFAYLADALDDLADDLRYGRYNPAVLRFGLGASSAQADVDAAKASLRAQLMEVRSELASCFSLLSVRRFGPILENIIYLGLPEAVNDPGNCKKEKLFDE